MDCTLLYSIAMASPAVLSLHAGHVAPLKKIFGCFAAHELMSALVVFDAILSPYLVAEDTV